MSGLVGLVAAVAIYHLTGTLSVTRRGLLAILAFVVVGLAVYELIGN